MAKNLNYAVVQGFVIAVVENEKNTRVVIKTRDDYSSRDNGTTKKEYILPITFVGYNKESAAKLITKGAYVSIEYKVVSYKRDGDEYDTLALNGVDFYLLPPFLTDGSDNNASNAKPKRAPKNSSPESLFDDDDEEDIPW